MPGPGRGPSIETTTSIDGTRLAFVRTGSGDPIILVPPAFGLRGIFAELAAELADDYTVISYDRRGRGDSTDALAGAQTWPQLIDGARLAAELIAGARFIEVPGGVGHALPPATTAAVLRDFFG